MRVCMLAYALYLNDARIKAYVKTLENHGHHVDVLVVGEPGKARIETQGTTRVFHLTGQYRGDSGLRYLWSYLKFFVAAFFTLSYLSIRQRYQAIHVHNMPNVLVFAAIVPRLLGVRIILDVHDLMPPNYMAKFDVDETHWLVRGLLYEQRFSGLFASQVLCADHSQREFLETACRISAKKLSVVMNLPNEEIFRSTREPHRSDRFELVYHGTIARRLGIDIMLDAVARVPPDVPVHLNIYGTGDFLDEALEVSRKLALDDRVHFSQGFFAVEMIPKMVGGMDLGIVGNRRTLACDRFMLPVKLLEYVYLGIPVVAPRLQIIQRYFGDDMLKYYEPENAADLARCIVQLYRNPSEGRMLAQNASKFYDRYNWGTQAKSYLRLIAGATTSQ
jgi:glycosyltransferase involved in cell wall biosynthesis